MLIPFNSTAGSGTGCVCVWWGGGVLMRSCVNACVAYDLRRMFLTQLQSTGVTTNLKLMKELNVMNTRLLRLEPPQNRLVFMCYLQQIALSVVYV